MPRHNSLQVKTSLDELSNVLNWFNSLYQKKISRDIFIQCQTMLAEAFTNAVRHAHRDCSLETPILIEVCLDDSQLEMRVWDFGPGFDPAQRVKYLETIDPEATGGRGIQLISRLADSFEYQRTLDNRNCLQMIKQYHPA